MSDATPWRRTRPFWGGLLTILGGVELLSIPFASQALPLVIQSGTVGASYLIALVLIAVGLLLWWQPGQRIFLGVVAVLVSLASFVYANLGGFLVGMLLGLVGGALAAAWTPEPAADEPADSQAPPAATGLTFTRRRVVSGDELANALPASPDEPSGGASSVWIGRVKDASAGVSAGDSGGDSARAEGSAAPGREPLPGDGGSTGGGGSGGSGGSGGGAHSAGRPDDGTAGPGHGLGHGPSGGGSGAGPGGKAGPGGRVLAIAALPLVLMSGTALHATGAISGPAAPVVATEAASVSAPSLTMTGMKFHGVVELPTQNGTVKMLWFTMDRAVLSGPRQTMGRTTLTGSTFTFAGNVDIYTTKMTGTLLGLHQEFTAEHPNVLVRALKLVPRLDLPLTMTDIVSEQPYVTADSLQAEGLRLVVAP
ncbi:hypothetical protein Psi02_60310 [Planotetraspora silvatica]|uniref:Uncharacterized protein n=1 Tax=Planotetraspora silvatica TaxID=234614 RepID=A0A8J3UQW7_9ACTN|nr:DUF6114 domain-containing protein [Planotetraspora silvatica]GII49607.1 hypothetical protein Psi02_60310 [Planotetraspora silvatica]